jgi:hypothetical protein
VRVDVRLRTTNNLTETSFQKNGLKAARVDGHHREVWRFLKKDLRLERGGRGVFSGHPV